MKNAKFDEKLILIHKKIEYLDLPQSFWGGCIKEGSQFHIIFSNQLGESFLYRGDGVDAIIKHFESANNAKVIGIGVRSIEASYGEKIASYLWLEHDIVTLELQGNSPEVLAENTMQEFETGIRKIKVADNRVEVPFLYGMDEYGDRLNRVQEYAKKIQNKKIVFINATPRGGGVALMRHALIRLFHAIGVDVLWYVLPNDPEMFKITKFKFHNILQGVADPRMYLTDGEKEEYCNYITSFGERIKETLKSIDIIVIDDPQPSGLIPLIKELNPLCKIIYRSHIEIVSRLAQQEGTSQQNTWDFLYQFIKDSDIFVSHPIDAFVPSMIDKVKVIYMPATTDPLDGINKPLTKSQTEYYFNQLNKLLIEDNQLPLDRNRPYITQIARFDPSKGIADVLESYAKARSKLDDSLPPQLVIAGNGSIDDPDGLPVLQLTKSIIDEKYRDLKDDIKVLQLPALDQLLNILLRNAKIALQLSLREGFEVKVTEALMKGVPVIAYNTGGIPLQIKDRVSGFLVEKGDTEEVSNLIVRLLTDDEYYKKLSNGAIENVNPDVHTVANAEKWMNLFMKLV